MKIQQLFCSLALVLISAAGYSQTGRIMGQVMDHQSKLPVTNAHIFIPNTTFQTYADSSGSFLIAGVPPGKWNLAVKNYGWDDYSDPILISPNGVTTLSLEIVQQTGFSPSEVALSKGKRGKLVEQCYEVLFGKDYKLNGIQIFGEGESLIFEETENKTNKVSSTGPLFVTNNATGYLITSYFEPFILESNQRPASTQVYFELPLPDGENSDEARNKKRLEIFENSSQKYLSLLMEGKIESFETDPSPSITVSSSKGDYFLSFQKPIELNLPNGRSGSIDYAGESIEIKLSGAPINPAAVKLGGFFETINSVYKIPENVFGDRLILLSNLNKTPESMQEKVMLQTDRSHYLKGEELFFKANMRYTEPLLRPSLSKVLHLEVMDTTGFLELHHVFAINEGKAFGSITLPVDLDQKNYFVRAYTSWSLNYGDQNSAFIPIQVHDPSLLPRSNLPLQNSAGVSIFTEKQYYEPGEQVNLNIMVTDQKSNPMTADLTVSILDVNQGLPSYSNQDLIGISPFQPISSDKSLGDFKFPLEINYAVMGKVTSNSSTVPDGNITALVNSLADLEKYKLDKAGSFRIPGLNFVEEFEIAIRAESRDGLPLRDISLEIERYPIIGTIPSFEFPELVRSEVKPLTVEEIQANMKEGEILMEEFTIEEEKADPRGTMIYGNPDNVVDPAKFQLNGNTAQFLALLSGQIAGMSVTGTPPAVRFRGGEPLVLIDGVPINFPSGTTLGGGGSGRTVAQVIDGINVFAIARVEVIKRTVPVFGDGGRNGIISIFMKTGRELELANEAMQNNFTSYKLTGYSTPKGFQEVQNEQKANPLLRGLSPTLYWNPELITTESELVKKVQFKSAESGGPMWVEIRGISEKGEIIYGSFLINAQQN
jgi:hypothetical protein